MNIKYPKIPTSKGLQDGCSSTCYNLTVNMTRKDKTPEGNKIVATASQDVVAFLEVVQIIEAARQRAYQAVNTELVGLYWQVVVKT